MDIRYSLKISFVRTLLVCVPVYMLQYMKFKHFLHSTIVITISVCLVHCTDILHKYGCKAKQMKERRINNKQTKNQKQNESNK